MTIRAALLDAPAASGKGKYTGVIDELADESALTEFHVPEVPECDLPPGRYVWEPGKDGKPGTFTDAETIARRSVPSIENAVIAIGAVLEAANFRLPEEFNRWRELAVRRKRATSKP